MRAVSRLHGAVSVAALSIFSATGCFEAAGAPAAGLIPYELNVPFWSDGAHKRRWLAVPDGETIEVAADGDLIFPVGSVLAKEFTLGEQRVETRLLVRHDDGAWAGYTYRWDPAQRDATLVPLGSRPTVAPWGDGDWAYPRRPDDRNELSDRISMEGDEEGPTL